MYVEVFEIPLTLPNTSPLHHQTPSVSKTKKQQQKNNKTENLFVNKKSE